MTYDERPKPDVTSTTRREPDFPPKRRVVPKGAAAAHEAAHRGCYRIKWRRWCSWFATFSLGIVLVGVFVEPQSTLTTTLLFLLLFSALAIFSWQDEHRSGRFD